MDGATLQAFTVLQTCRQGNRVHQDLLTLAGDRPAEIVAQLCMLQCTRGAVGLNPQNSWLLFAHNEFLTCISAQYSPSLVFQLSAVPHAHKHIRLKNIRVHKLD